MYVCEAVAVNVCVPSQALKHLRRIQVINFGDCLVRPAGAAAIAETVSEGLPTLKVRECFRSGLSLIPRSIMCWQKKPNYTYMSSSCCLRFFYILPVFVTFYRNSICLFARSQRKLLWLWHKQ